MSTQTPRPPEEKQRSGGIPLGRMFGVPVLLAWSWFVIAAFILLIFGPQVQRLMPEIGVGAYGVAFGYALLLLFSVLVHELAHALTARAFHWPTAKIVLNLWGGHTQFDNFNATPGKSLLVALSGPVANFALAGLGSLVLPLFRGEPIPFLLTDIFILANFLVAVFNILPGLPLDGGRLVETAVWKLTGSQEKGTVAAGWAGRVIVVLLVVGVVGIPLLRGGTPDLQMVVLMVLVCGFLWMGASSAIEHARMRLRLPSVSAGQLKLPATSLPATAMVAQVQQLLAREPELNVVLTAATGQPEAVVDRGALSQVPPSAAAQTPAAAVSRALAPGAYVPEVAAGQELVQYLARLAGSEYAVIDGGGRVTGVLQQSTVVRAITGKPGRL